MLWGSIFIINSHSHAQYCPISSGFNECQCTDSKWIAVGGEDLQKMNYPPLNHVQAMGLKPELVGTYEQPLILLKQNGQSFANEISGYGDDVRSEEDMWFRCMFLDAIDYVTHRNDRLVSRGADPGPEYGWDAQMNEANDSILRLKRTDVGLPTKNKQMAALYKEHLQSTTVWRMSKDKISHMWRTSLKIE